MLNKTLGCKGKFIVRYLLLFMQFVTDFCQLFHACHWKVIGIYHLWQWNHSEFHLTQQTFIEHFFCRKFCIKQCAEYCKRKIKWEKQDGCFPKRKSSLCGRGSKCCREDQIQRPCRREMLCSTSETSKAFKKWTLDLALKELVRMFTRRWN